ncbi:MAG TPA: apolipoprotein N-acyltransferase [Egicoccus sp.]|nr:apolipoprotein N-acyltransferase [Egicoccus sp.]HSK24263.1 apolipoprotein N-acyltransferase [Egicoccus sp.]
MLLAPALAAAAGLAVLASHPPVGWWWLSFLAPGLLLAALEVDAAVATREGRPSRPFRLGLLTGLSTFGPMLSWLIMPAGTLGWALLATVQAAFFGLLAVAVRPLLRSAWLPLAVALAWTGVDAWRAVWPLNGFEWGAVSYAHTDGSWLLPVARLVGGPGITLLVVAIGAAAYVVVRDAVEGLRARESGPVEHALAGTRAPVLVLVGALLVSVLATIEPPAPTGSLDVLAVQGNDIRHWEEEVDDASFRITTQMRDLTVDATREGPPPQLTVWPEASIDTDPFSERGARFLPLLEAAATTSDHLLAGMNIDGPDPRTGFWRTQLLVDDAGEEVGRYDKRRVVPFGEYIPARRFLEWFPPLEQIPRDILPHPEAHNVEVGDVPVAVLICFETLFPSINRSNILTGDEPARLIVAATTDASYGISGEADQHLAQSRLRAVESGRWVVHASLSGASAFVDPHGRVSDKTDLFTATTIRREVPLVDGLTPYLVIGDVVGWLARAGVALLLAWAFWLRRRVGVAEGQV